MNSYFDTGHYSKEFILEIYECFKANRESNSFILYGINLVEKKIIQIHYEDDIIPYEIWFTDLITSDEFSKLLKNRYGEDFFVNLTKEVRDSGWDRCITLNNFILDDEIIDNCLKDRISKIEYEEVKVEIVKLWFERIRLLNE